MGEGIVELPSGETDATLPALGTTSLTATGSHPRGVAIGGYFTAADYDAVK